MDIYAAVEKRFRGFSLRFDARWSGPALLLGPNGSGKSTVLRCLSGVYSCKSRVEIDGMPAGPGLFYYVPPAPRLPPTVTVGEYLQHLSEVFQRDIRPRFGVEDFLAKRGAELSSGMAARVLLTVAASLDKIPLLDEPLSYLETRFRVELVRSLAGRPFILATHDPAPFLVLKPTLIYIQEGRVTSVASWEKAKAAYLEACGDEICVKWGEMRYVVGYG